MNKFDDNFENRHQSEYQSMVGDVKNFMKSTSGKWIKRGAIGLTALVMSLSSMYTVKPSEQAVVTRFGSYVRTEGSGFHFKAPFIEHKKTVDVQNVRRFEVGFRTNDAEESEYEEVEVEALMLTGDKNMLKSHFSVQYQVSDPAKFLFNVYDVKATLFDAAEAAHRQIVGDNHTDKTMTYGRAEIEQETKDLMENIIAKYDMGIDILAIRIQDVDPPTPEVEAAFAGVETALKNKDRAYDQARTYANEQIPAARAKAGELINQAEGYKAKVVNQAIGDVARFEEIYAEYKRAPAITMERMYIETMEDVMKRVDKVIIDEDASTFNMLDISKSYKGGGN